MGNYLYVIPCRGSAPLLPALRAAHILPTAALPRNKKNPVHRFSSSDAPGGAVNSLVIF